MIVGCYSVYCNNQHSESMPLYKDGTFIGYYESPMSYTGETRAECIRAAREAGWKIHKDMHLCPLCTGRYRTISSKKV